ncbi:MAG: hypothetical protein IPP14_15670 [Planctomycetes bacterium]|nr:hypothetical protein [Planctomycetota bacterium]
MSNTIPTSGIRAQGTAVPTHTAARGVLYLRTTDNTVWMQTAGPTGVVWELIGPLPGPGSYVPYRVTVNPGTPGSYERV